LGLAGTAGLAAALAACEAPAGYPGSARPSTNPRPSAGLTPPATSIPPPAPLQSPAAVSDVILCRDAWGAKPPRPGGTPQIPSRMTIHHTAVVLGDNSNAPAR